jgi:rhodanese-related sulfurtransferase
MSIKSITPNEVFRLQQESGAITIVDVREADEFAEVCSSDAKNFPLSTLNVRDIANNFDRRTPIYVLCRSGKRSMRAAAMFVSEGFHSVYNIDGGMIEWEASGLPVVRK